MLNVTTCIVRLHFSNFCFTLSSVADISNIETKAPTSAGNAPFLTAQRAMQFGQVVEGVGSGNLSMPVFILVFRRNSYRWAAVVPRSNYLIHATIP